jgi:tetratricopeptide (TPR) repeat protein
MLFDETRPLATATFARRQRLRLVATVLAVGGVLSTPLTAGPFVPAKDAQVLATLPPGARHAELSAKRLARGRLDVAVPLAQFYIGQARTTGDLRFLGYAEAVLGPWVTQATAEPAALVLQATLQQSRHEFDAALATLDRSLAHRPNDAQAWLTRATVLRVVGRYAEASESCGHFARWADPVVSLICEQGLKGLTGHLESAYATLGGIATQGMLDAERAWRDAELAEMAVRLGRDAEAERWFREGLAYNPKDFYVKAAYADLLLRQHRSVEVLTLLKGEQSIEPLLLRLAIAQKQLHDPGLARSSALLQAAFAAEAARGEAVHRREQARFLLEVQIRPQEALAAAVANWAVQREPDDTLILVAAARAAGALQRAQPALEFARTQGLLDVRLASADGPRS